MTGTKSSTPKLHFSPDVYAVTLALLLALLVRFNLVLTLGFVYGADTYLHL
jgi:hypothetical protein